MADYYYEMRYTETDNFYSCQIWSTEHGALRPRADKHIGMRPEWLTKIVAVAHAGRHIRIVESPPPDLILWFKTDKDYNLVNFVEFNE